MSPRQLVVRDLPEDLVRRLRERAVAHGRSAEAEHREILRLALTPQKTSFKAALLAMPDVGDDALFARARRASRKVNLR